MHAVFPSNIKQNDHQSRSHGAGSEQLPVLFIITGGGGPWRFKI
jgi:hypothetical protein